MSKYELELSDEAVQAFIRDLRNGLGDLPANHIADILEAQIPIPVPVKIGAVVRTARAGDYLRWAFDSQTVEPWIEVRDPNIKTYRTSELGPITAVLSPGVDL